MARFMVAPYPIGQDAAGLLHTQSDVEQIKSDLLILLLTSPGERVMLPEFGTDLRQLIFEPNDAVLEQRAIDIITQSIRTWEPRVVVEETTIMANPSLGAIK